MAAKKEIKDDSPLAWGLAIGILNVAALIGGLVFLDHLKVDPLADRAGPSVAEAAPTSLRLPFPVPAPSVRLYCFIASGLVRGPGSKIT